MNVVFQALRPHPPPALRPSVYCTVAYFYLKLHCRYLMLGCEGSLIIQRVIEIKKRLLLTIVLLTVVSYFNLIVLY